MDHYFNMIIIKIKKVGLLINIEKEFPLFSGMAIPFILLPKIEPSRAMMLER